jgi:hypothetical protein
MGTGLLRGRSSSEGHGLAVAALPYNDSTNSLSSQAVERQPPPT